VSDRDLALITAIQSFAGFIGRLGQSQLDWRLVALLSGTSVVGCLAGAMTAHRFPPVALQRGFACLILGVASSCSQGSEKFPIRRKFSAAAEASAAGNQGEARGTARGMERVGLGRPVEDHA
jgi:uncharacterized membrane protein YfcA